MTNKNQFEGIQYVKVVDLGLSQIYLSELGQLLYKHDLVWCERFGLRDVRDLENRILSSGDYQHLWLDRCEKAYHLLSQTNEARRESLAKLCPALFLYGASRDLSILYFEDEQEQTYTILNN